MAIPLERTIDYSLALRDVRSGAIDVEIDLFDEATVGLALWPSLD
jgi:hypothetical protein